MSGWLLLAPLALAADDVGVPVTVKVYDEVEATPIPAAVVRHPDEQDRHRVNTETGEWTGSVLYLPDGTELVFAKGMTLELEVSAPGYVNARVSYVVRKRRNVISVPLTRMKLDMSVEDPENISIQFKRSQPLD